MCERGGDQLPGSKGSEISEGEASNVCIPHKDRSGRAAARHVGNNSRDPLMVNMIDRPTKQNHPFNVPHSNPVLAILTAVPPRTKKYHSYRLCAARKAQHDLRQRRTIERCNSPNASGPPSRTNKPCLQKRRIAEWT